MDSGQFHGLNVLRMGQKIAIHCIGILVERKSRFGRHDKDKHQAKIKVYGVPQTRRIINEKLNENLGRM
jgi:hypothetical protein